MACEHEAQLSLQHDDLSEAQRAHLAICASCAAVHRALDAVGEAVRAEAARIEPPSASAQLAALREVLQQAPLWRRRVAVPLPVLGGVLAAMVVVLLVLLRAPAVDGRLVIEVVKVQP